MKTWGPGFLLLGLVGCQAHPPQKPASIATNKGTSSSAHHAAPAASPSPKSPRPAVLPAAKKASGPAGTQKAAGPALPTKPSPSPAKISQESPKPSKIAANPTPTPERKQNFFEKLFGIHPHPKTSAVTSHPAKPKSTATPAGQLLNFIGTTETTTIISTKPVVATDDMIKPAP